MAVVVQQTLPFDLEALDLANPERWDNLLPLIRLSVLSRTTKNGRTVLIDTAHPISTPLRVVLVSTLGNFSSKVLDEKSVTAVVTGRGGADVLDVPDILQVLDEAAAEEAAQHTNVIVKIANKRGLRQHDAQTWEVDVEAELIADHLLHVLGNATESSRSSTQQVGDLLRLFVEHTTIISSRFHVEKVGGSPAMRHADDTQSFTHAKQAVERDLKTVLGKVGAGSGDVSSVHYSDINGLSRLENYILAKDIAEYLESQNLAYHISHSTILDHGEQARGYGISILRLSSGELVAQAQPQRHETVSAAQDLQPTHILAPSTSRITFNDREVRRRVEAGCAALIKEEPTITDYDTIVGDGDCGYTLRDGAKQVLSFIAGKDLTRLPETLGALVRDLEVNMGGTSGALYCIFLTALSQSLAAEETVPAALQAALRQLFKYTRARLGDRTMMDALIPFIDTLASTRDVGRAIDEAETGVQGTKKMEAKLGRSAYLDASATDGVPDPGAYGLLVLLKGMVA